MKLYKLGLLTTPILNYFVSPKVLPKKMTSPG